MDNIPKNTLNKIQKYDDLLFQLENDLIQLKNLIKEFKKSQKTANQLSSYVYSDEYLDDVEKYESQCNLHIFGQDYPYNAIMEFKDLQIQLLKLISKDL